MRFSSRKLLLPLGMVLLSGLASMSSSSGADDVLFARSVQQLERLWSGVLGCTHPGEGEPRSTFETTLDNSGGAPSAIRHDYAECGKRALRSTSSRMLVNTIEDSLRQGGVALFDERFRLDSSIGWVWDENVTGEFDALIPLVDAERSDGTGQALFLQPGAVFWPGIESEDRIDANLGLVYRRSLTPDIIVGASAFYDHDFQRGSQRVGLGLDVQSGVLHTALNYYHPLTEWEEGRTNYEEQPMQGADFRLGFTWSRFRIDGNIGLWRFEGEEHEKREWRSAYGIEAGYQVLPGIFLQGGYERHDPDDSLDSRWNAGLAFRFSLPGLRGTEGGIGGGHREKPDLWKLFEREKRILYEERTLLGVNLNVENAMIYEPGASGDGEMPTATIITGTISGRELRADETLEVVVLDSGTAEHGEGYDFTFSQGLYGTDTLTGSKVSLAESSACTTPPCRMDTPANSRAKSIEVKVSALEDSEEPEAPEFIDIRVDVRNGSGNVIHSSDVARVTIQGHGNTVEFSQETDSPEVGSIAEENETSFDIILDINRPLPEGTNASVTLERSGTATSNDFTLSPADDNNGVLVDNDDDTWTWTLPTERGTAALRITAVADSDDEEADPERATFEITELTGAAGWSLGDAKTRDVDITKEDETLRADSAFIWGDITTPPNIDAEELIEALANDSTVRFSSETSMVEEDVSGGVHNIEVETVTFGNITRSDTIMLRVAASGGTATRLDDYRVASSVTINANDERTNIPVTIMDDRMREIDETIELTITTQDGDLPEGWRIGSQTTHTVTITDNDNAVSFSETAGTIAEENETSFDIVLNINQPLPAGTNVSVTLMAIPDRAAAGTDYELVPPTGTNGALVDNNDDTWTWTLPTEQTEARLQIRALNDNDNDDGESVTFRLANLTGQPSNWSIMGGNLTISITDNDGPPSTGGTFRFSSPDSPIELAEGGPGAGFSIFFENEPLASETILRIAFAELGTAPNAASLNDVTFVASGSAGVMYDENTENLTIPMGATSPVTLTVSADSDSTAEVEEGFTLSTSTDPSHNTLPPNYMVEATSHTVAIVANENTVTFGSLSRSTIPEGENATISVTINRQIPAGATPQPTVIITPSALSGDGDAMIGTDYRLSAGGTPLTGNTWMLPTGSGTAELTIETLETNSITVDREFTLTLEPTLPEGWTTTSQAIAHFITITNNDNPTIGFGSGATSTAEGTTAHSIPLEIVHSGSAGFDIMVTAAGDLAAAGVSASNNTVTINGTGNQSWEINIPENSLVDGGDRTVTLMIDPNSLPQSGGWEIASGKNTHTLTITDNDTGTIGFASGSGPDATEDLSDTTVEVDVEIVTGTPASPFDIPVRASSTSTAMSGQVSNNDFSIPATLTIPTSGTAKLAVEILADTEAEPDEMIILEIPAGTYGGGFSLGANTQHRITIPANDNTVSFSGSTGTINELNATSFNIVLNIDQSLPAGTTAEVVLTAMHNAASGGDYTLALPASGNNGALMDNNDDTWTWTLPTGTGTAMLAITAVDDSDNDDNETVTFTLADPTGVTGWAAGSGTLTVSITDDDDPPLTGGTFRLTSVSAPPVELAEGLSGQNFTVSFGNPIPSSEPNAVLRIAFAGLGNAPNAAALNDVTFATSPAGVTYNENTGDLTIPSSAASTVTLTVTARSDSTAEVEERFTLSTSTDPSHNTLPSGYSVAATSHTVTIAANENTITFGNPSSTRITENGGSATVALNIMQPIPAGETATITVTPTNANLTRDTDYSLSVSGGSISGNVWTLPTGAGAGSAELTVAALTDITSDEIIELEFAAATLPDGWSIAGNTTPDITIADVPIVPTVVFINPSSTLLEADGTTDVGIRLSQAPSGSLTVTASITSGDQYIELASTTVTVTGGTTGNFTVNIPSNVASIPPNTSAVLGLTAPGGWALGTQSTHTVNITPATQRVAFATGNGEYTAPEGMPFNVNFTVGTAHTAAFDIDASIPVDDQPFVSVASTPSNTFAANSSSGTITFNVGNVSNNRTVVIPLAKNTNFPAGWRLVPDSVTLMIEPTPAGTVGFASPRTIDLTEDGSAENATLQLLLPSGAAFTGTTPAIPLALAFGGVQNDNDYTIDFATAAHGSLGTSPDLLSVAMGQTHSNGEISLRIEPQADDTAEHPEEYTVTLSEGANFPPGWSVNPGANKLTIRIPGNDNIISFGNPSPSSINEDGGTATITATINREIPENTAPGDRTITITPAGDATKGDDYQLSVPSDSSHGDLVDNGATWTWTLPDGATSGNMREAELTITAIDNPDAEGEKSFTLRFGADTLPSGWSVDTTNDSNVHTVSIADDDTSFVQFAAAYADGITLNENAPWPAAGKKLVETTQTVPKDPNIVSNHSTFSVRLRVDDTDPHFDYVGITTTRNAPYNSSQSFKDQGYSQLISPFYNTDFNQHVVNNGLVYMRTSDNALSEGPQDVTIFLEVAPGSSLPPGWAIGERNTLTVTVNDNENFIRWDEKNPKEFTEGQGAVELRLYASAGGVTIGRAPPAGSGQINNSFAQLRLPGSPDPLPRTIGFNKTSGSFGVQFPPNRFATGGPQDIHYNDVYVPFDGSGGHTKVIASRHFAVNDSSTRPKNENNGQGYTLFIGEDNNFTDDVLVYEIYQVALSNSGWGTVVGHPLRWKFTVKDNDEGGEISFAESKSNVAEGSSVPVTISIVQPLKVESGVVLNLSTNTGDAVYGTDYTITGTGGAVYDSNTSVLTLPAGMKEVTFTVAAMENSDPIDLSDGLDKSFTITLEPRPSPNGLPANWSIPGTKNTHTVSITDNDVGFGFAEQSTIEVFEDPMMATETTVDIDLQVTGATIPAGGFRIPVEITGADNPVLRGEQSVMLAHYNVLEEAEHDNKTLDQFIVGDELLIRAGAGPSDNPRLTIKLPHDTMPEPGGTITFTLPPSLTLISGASRTHELKIEPSDSAVFFTGSDNASTRPEGSGKHEVLIKFNQDAGAPSGGVPLKLEITSGDNNKALDNLVTFNMDGTPKTLKEFTVPAGQTEQKVEIYINDNESVTNNPPVILTISKGDNNFPDDWGFIVPDAKIHTLTVVNDDSPNIRFAIADQEVSEGDTAEVGLVFSNYTIPAGPGINLSVGVAGTATRTGSGADADYGGTGGITNSILVPLTASDNADPSFNIGILSNTVAGGEEDETVILTLSALPAGVIVGDIGTHTITIPANENIVRFSTASEMVNENVSTKMVTFMVSLSLAGAPADKLPLKIDITEGNGDNLVTFNSDGSPNNSDTFEVPAGMNSHPITVYINNNSNDVVQNNQAVKFKLSEGNNFPSAWGSISSSGDEFTLTVVDDDGRVGITQSNRVGVLNEPSTGQTSTLSVPVGALGGATAATALASVMTEDAVLQVSLYDRGFVGDQEVSQGNRNNPFNPDGSRDYTIGTLTIDKDTGTGSLHITINEDAFPEGREWAFLRISDPNGELPPGWTVDPNHSDYRLIIYGNDNGMRFAEWPRSNPGSVSTLSATVAEGGSANMLVLLSHLAPGPRDAPRKGTGGIAALIDVPDAYEDDIRITRLNNIESTYNQNTGRIWIYRMDDDRLRGFPRNDRTGNWFEVSGNTNTNIAAVLKIDVLPDTDDSEGEEVIEITLKDEASPPAQARAWGSVRNIPDMGNPQVSTSTTFTLRIPGKNDNIFFELPDSNVVEGDSTTVDVMIVPQLTTAASVSLASSNSNVTITSPHYNAGNGVLTLPASTGKVTLTLETMKDTNAAPDTVTLTLSQRQAPNALPVGHEIGRSTHRLAILEERIIGFGGGAPTNGAHVRLNETNTTSAMVDVVPTAHSSLIGELSGVVLDVVVNVTSQSVNSDGTADFTIGTLTLDAMGRGRFSFTVNDDNLTEPNETVTLSLAESSTSPTPLPPGWVLSEETYKILIEASDNALRFAEWPRGTGNYARLAGEVLEGGNYVPTIMLLTNPPPAGGLPIEIVVESGHESGHENDVAFRVVNNDHLAWNANTNILTVKASPNHGAVALEVGALNDNQIEGSEEITITMRPASGFPSSWGTVANVVDTGTPTSLTYTLTVNDHAARFAEWPRGTGNYARLAGTIAEGDSSSTANMVVLLTRAAPAGGLPIEIVVEGGHENDVVFTNPNPSEATWNDATKTLTVMPGGVTASLRVTALDDSLIEGTEEITITMRPATGFPSSWGTVANVADEGTPITPTSLTYTLTITDDDP